MTKRPGAVELNVFVPSGSVTLGEVTGIGFDPEITAHRDGQDVVRLKFTKTAQVKSTALEKFLRDKFSL